MLRNLWIGTAAHNACGRGENGSGRQEVGSRCTRWRASDGTHVQQHKITRTFGSPRGPRWQTQGSHSSAVDVWAALRHWLLLRRRMLSKTGHALTCWQTPCTRLKLASFLLYSARAGFFSTSLQARHTAGARAMPDPGAGVAAGPSGLWPVRQHMSRAGQPRPPKVLPHCLSVAGRQAGTAARGAWERGVGASQQRPPTAPAGRGYLRRHGRGAGATCRCPGPPSPPHTPHTHHPPTCRVAIAVLAVVPVPALQGTNKSLPLRLCACVSVSWAPGRMPVFTAGTNAPS